MEDRITLDNLRADVLVGILDREQKVPQPIEIDLAMELDLHPSGEFDALERSVDYAAVTDQVLFLAANGRFRLIETLALAIARLLLLPPAVKEPRAPLLAVEISIRKPTILGGRAVPGLFLRREFGGLFVESAPQGDGIWLDTLCSTGWNSAHRVRLDPGWALVLPGYASVMPISGDITYAHGQLSSGRGGAALVVSQPRWR